MTLRKAMPVLEIKALTKTGEIEGYGFEIAFDEGD